MILTEKELERVRQAIEVQAGLDEELVRRCGTLIHMDRFDEAVRSAFILLEERLRDAVDKEGMTGTKIANYAFNPENGPLAKHLGRTPSEREGLRELYSGAFKLFRNPTAHGAVGYGSAEGKAVIGLVNLLLLILKRVEELPPLGLFPEHLEAALTGIEQGIGPGATSRLRVFLGKCIQELGMDVRTKARQWIPFRRYAMYKADGWDEARPHRVAVFYLVSTGGESSLLFPTDYYYPRIVDFNVELLIDALLEIGFQPAGKNMTPRIDLRTTNRQDFFDTLFRLLSRVTDELEETLVRD